MFHMRGWQTGTGKRSVVVSLSLSRVLISTRHCSGVVIVSPETATNSMEPQSELLLQFNWGYTPGGNVSWIMNSWAVLPAVGWCVLAYLCHSVVHEHLPLLVSDNPVEGHL
jgi:hypothetical protein